MPNYTDIFNIAPCPVVLDNINRSPGPYCMSFGFDLESLIQSIGRVGLINSPLLIENGNEGLTVVSGYRRIQAAIGLKWTMIPCRVLLKTQLSHPECLLLNLHDNLTLRRLNHVEKGMALRRLSLWFSKKEVLDQYMPLLDLPSHEDTLLLYMVLENELPPEIKDDLAMGRLSIHAAGILLKMNPEDRDKVFKMLKKLKLNFNNQKQVLEYVNDISIINGVSIAGVLEDPSLEKLASSKELNRPQRNKEVFRFLRAKRFPSLISSERRFRKITSRLGLPKEARIVPPPYFEAPNYRLEIIFRDGKHLKKSIENLSAINGLKDLGDPWEITG